MVMTLESLFKLSQETSSFLDSKKTKVKAHFRLIEMSYGMIYTEFFHHLK